ncbi:MAG: ATP-binding protein [Deltaproteobacteria bacterium]|nr:ATP-binding protein [Deltaproteobacteria bacterium]
MFRRENDLGTWRWAVSPQACLFLWTPIALISLAHYGTGHEHHWLHDIYRRLYYLPIVLGAFLFGLRGALSASLLASMVYAPHAFTHFFHQDPGSAVEKVLELLLYNLVAFITGKLADREYTERVRQETTAKKLQATLDEMRVMEQQLVRSGRLEALGQLTAGLAHEMKNPLASLKGAADIISDEIPETSPRRRMVDILRKELTRLETLLERFLSFARPERIDAHEVCVCDVIDKTLLLVEAQARKSGVTIAWDKSQEMVHALGDPDKISQVLLNLVLNAVQAMPGGGRIDITCGYETRGKRRYGMFAVADTGPGIGEAIREKIFDPFFTTREAGSGLGLSIAARIVDEHGGMIEVAGAPAGGAVFRVLLPRAA